MKKLLNIAIILFGILVSSCGTSRTFQIDYSKNSLYYHDAYWVAKIKPEGAPAKITVINDMHIDTSTNRVTVYAQSRVLGKIVSPPFTGYVWAQNGENFLNVTLQGIWRRKGQVFEIVTLDQATDGNTIIAKGILNFAKKTLNFDASILE